MRAEGILLTGGLILVAGTIAGALARALRLPTVSGYLAAGILLGPYGIDWIPHDHGEALARPVTDLTMALVLFVLGAEFRVDRIRGRERPALVFALVDALVTFVAVAVASWTVLDSLPGGILLGVMAVAVAPATTVAVLQEYDAHGPTSDTLRLATALSNVVSIFAFEMALLVLIAVSGGPARLESIAWSVVGSVVYGAIAGHALILLQERFGLGNYALPLLTVLLTTIGLCKATDVPFMLVFLVTGGVVASRSPFFEPISSAMEVYAKPAYVAFFVLSGWHLDFKVLAASWVAVAVYAGARIIGRVLGARVGVAAAGKPMEGVGRQLGLGLLCQAGAAIALAHLTSRYDPELGARLLNIILGAVVLFEIAGPLLVRRIVVAAGEVRVAQLLVRSVPRFQTPWLRALRRMLRGRMRLGRRDIESLTVGDLTRRNHTPLPAGADMDEILHYANRSSLQRFPVVGEDGRLRGLIQLQDLSDAVYDPQAAPLVIADDLTTVRPESVSLPADASLREAADFFGRYDANHAPVVDDKESLQYRGVVERAEVLRLVRDLRRRNEEDAA